VADLTEGTDRRADEVVVLTARRGRVRLDDGRSVPGYTVNGPSPGPLIEVTQGDLLEVQLRNADVADGITLPGTGSTCPTRRTASPG
jgi:FtsP/CotA-like multicopper oxidase with cupredoxin domain